MYMRQHQSNGQVLKTCLKVGYPVVVVVVVKALKLLLICTCVDKPLKAWMCAFDISVPGVLSSGNYCAPHGRVCYSQDSDTCQ